MRLLKKVFIVNTQERFWLKIILWWEIRRLLFNALLILFALLSLHLSSAIPGKGYIYFNSGPAIIVWFSLSFILFFLIANICYTTGWITQVLLRKLKYRLIKKLVSKLFILGILFSFIIILIPCTLVLLNIILPDELIDIFYTTGIRLFNFFNEL